MEKKGKETWNFSDTFSDGVRILTKAEQERIYELLGIPIFRQVSDDSESLSEADSSFRSAHLKEKILLLEHQLLEIKSDKEYLKNQVLKGQNEKEELLQSNAELRILLQNTIKQNGTLQNSLSELTSENLKINYLKDLKLLKRREFRSLLRKRLIFTLIPNLKKIILSQYLLKNVIQNTKVFSLNSLSIKKNEAHGVLLIVIPNDWQN